MKIKWKFIILFSIVVTTGIGVSSYYTLSLVNESVIFNELQEMRTLAVERENQIQTLHDRASEDLIFTLKNPLFVEYFELPETRAGNVYENGVLQFTDNQKEIKAELEQLVYHFQNKFDVDETCIIDMSGQEHARLVLSIIESDEYLSPDEKLTPFFEPSFEKNLDEVHIEFPYISPDTNRWVFAYTSPIVLGDKEKPAFYHFEMPISIFQDIVNVEHGRMYVIDPQGYLIADSETHYSSTNISEEFTEYFPQVSKILPDDAFAEIIQNVKTSDQGTISYTGDDGDIYHGVYSNLPTFGWILFYQEDEELMFSEHSSFLGNIQYTISIIIAATFAGTIISIFVISNTITRPLTKLQKHTKNIIDGKLNEKIKIKSNDEVGDLTAAFNHMTNSLKKSNSAQNEFVSFISHELKNPLVPIKTYTELLLSKNLGELNEKQIDRIKLIQSSAELLQKLISDFSQVKKMEASALKLNKEICYISEPINDAVEKLLEDISKNNINLTTNFAEGIKCSCDKQKIVQVITNLISNSIDFCPMTDGKIEIILSSEKNNVKIVVKDNGVGISKEHLKKVFESYFQVDSTLSREYGGTGLGLPICKGIIELHGGKIWIESKIGEGTQVIILLPKDKSLKSVSLPKEAEQEIDMK